MEYGQDKYSDLMQSGSSALSPQYWLCDLLDDGDWYSPECHECHAYNRIPIQVEIGKIARTDIVHECMYLQALHYTSSS